MIGFKIVRGMKAAKIQPVAVRKSGKVAPTRIVIMTCLLLSSTDVMTGP